MGLLAGQTPKSNVLLLGGGVVQVKTLNPKSHVLLPGQQGGGVVQVAQPKTSTGHALPSLFRQCQDDWIGQADCSKLERSEDTLQHACEDE